MKILRQYIKEYGKHVRKFIVYMMSVIILEHTRSTKILKWDISSYDIDVLRNFQVDRQVTKFIVLMMPVVICRILFTEKYEICFVANLHSPSYIIQNDL